jgi:8-oxo-dGTP diphosphatase
MEAAPDQIKDVRPSVKIIFRNAGKIMLIKLANGTIDIPGGGIEYGESNAETLRRELEEELGFREFDPRQMKLFHSWHYISRKKKRHSVYIVYTYDLDVVPEFHSDEINETVWMTYDDVTRMDHVPEFKEMLLRAFGV